MLDQNITTILLSTLTVVGTLGGTILGTVLNSRSTTKLEKSRRNYEAEQEKLKRDNAVIEDVYQTLVSVNDLCVQLAYDVKNLKNDDKDTVRRIKVISSSSQKITMLVRLHLSSLKEDVKEYEDSIITYWNELGNYSASRDALSSSVGVSIQERLVEAEHTYKISLANIEAKLEKLIK